MAVNEQLEVFVKRGLEQRLDRAQMEQALLQAGWPPDQVRKALGAYVDVDFPIPVPRPLPSGTTRDAFMCIIVLGTMVLCAYQFGALLFEIINRIVPDPMDARRFNYPGSDTGIRWSISTLIVAFPVFVVMSRLVNRAARLDPTKRVSRVRRRLTYVVLFVASAALIGDLLGFAGSRGRARDVDGTMMRRVFPYVVGTAIAVAIVAGLVLVGSPSAQRMRRLDQIRVGDLRQLSDAVGTYFGREGMLPRSVDALAAAPNASFRTTMDPATSEPYSYRAIDESRYELCATFDAADTDGTYDNRF